MNKILIVITLLTLLISSCDRNPANFTKGIVITDIISTDSGCLYYTKTSFIMDKFNRYPYLYDSCGKYTVGDTLKLIRHGNNMY